MDDDTLLLDEGVGRADDATTISQTWLIHYMLHLLHEGVTAEVVGVVHEMRDVVALQLQHQLHIIADVVCTQTEGFGQVALVDTAGYTAYKTHLRQVVEPYSIQRLGDGKGVFAFLYLQDTIALEHVSWFEDTQYVGLTLAYRQFEITVRACRQRHTVAQHRVAVQGEHRTRYRYGRELVQRTTGQTRGGSVGEVNTR